MSINIQSKSQSAEIAALVSSCQCQGFVISIDRSGLHDVIERSLPTTWFMWPNASQRFLVYHVEWLNEQTKKNVQNAIDIAVVLLRDSSCDSTGPHQMLLEGHQARLSDVATKVQQAGEVLTISVIIEWSVTKEAKPDSSQWWDERERLIPRDIDAMSWDFEAPRPAHFPISFITWRS